MDLNRYPGLALVALAMSLVQAAGAYGQKPITSRVESTKNGDLFVIQEVVIPASVDRVWAAYTTTKGWKSWVAPVAHVDWKIGGLIRTNYRKGGRVDDADAIKLTIINYVPQRILTLQAHLADNWPELLKKNQKRMYNVLVFEPMGKSKTKLISYGIGYKDDQQHRQMMKFFIPANEKSYQKLIAYLSAKPQAKKAPGPR